MNNSNSYGTPNSNPWLEAKRFNDGEIALVVMRQSPLFSRHLPRFSYHVGRANGEHISPHIPMFTKVTPQGININFPSKRILDLLYEAEAWVQNELEEAHQKSRG